MDHAILYGSLEELLGPKGWLTDKEEVAARSRDWLGRTGTQPLGIAVPKSTVEVSKIVRACALANVSITPLGGNTGLVGGTILPHAQSGIILSLSRMNSQIAIDKTAMTVTVDAGVVLAKLHEIVDQKGLMFPLHLGSEGSAQIGGLIATNAGGSHAMRYGSMIDQVLGIEAVMGDGTVWNGLRSLIKDNAGYQLRRLFCGSEGTLGIVTKAVLKLSPKPSSISTALVGVADMSTAIKLGQLARQRLGDFVTGLEFFSDIGVKFLNQHVPAIDFPMESACPMYVLIEAESSIDVSLDGFMENLLEEAYESELVSDGTVAANEKQRNELWQLREEIPEGQRLEGVQLKHDISVPIADMDRFLEKIEIACNCILPDVRVNPFGHLGDGNIHLNLSPPTGENSFQGRENQLSGAIYELSESLGGSFAAEHGIGSIKVDYADQLRSKVERNMMRKLKSAFDPDNILNPRVVV